MRTAVCAYLRKECDGEFSPVRDAIPRHESANPLLYRGLADAELSSDQLVWETAGQPKNKVIPTRTVMRVAVSQTR